MFSYPLHAKIERGTFSNRIRNRKEIALFNVFRRSGTGVVSGRCAGGTAG